MANALKTRVNRFRSYAALREPDGHANVIFPWQARLTPRRGEKPRVPRFPRGFLIDRMNSQRIARNPAQQEGASVAVVQDNSQIVETSIPARLDSLHWSGFHTRVVLALGITWILDGLEVTLAGALSGAVKA